MRGRASSTSDRASGNESLIVPSSTIEPRSPKMSLYMRAPLPTRRTSSGRDASPTARLPRLLDPVVAHPSGCRRARPCRRRGTPRCDERRVRRRSSSANSAPRRREGRGCSCPRSGRTGHVREPCWSRPPPACPCTGPARGSPPRPRCSGSRSRPRTGRSGSPAGGTRCARPHATTSALATSPCSDPIATLA